MPTVNEVNEFLFSIAPVEMAADFDNVVISHERHCAVVFRGDDVELFFIVVN